MKYNSSQWQHTVRQYEVQQLPMATDSNNLRTCPSNYGSSTHHNINNQSCFFACELMSYDMVMPQNHYTYTQCDVIMETPEHRTFLITWNLRS